MKHWVWTLEDSSFPYRDYQHNVFRKRKTISYNNAQGKQQSTKEKGHF